MEEEEEGTHLFSIGCLLFHCESDISSTGSSGSNIPPAAENKDKKILSGKKGVFIGLHFRTFVST